MSNSRRTPSNNEEAILLSEVDGLCPICNKTLIYKKQGRWHKRWEAAHIYPLNPTSEEIELLKNETRLSEDVNDISNFIALCRNCHKEFDHPRTVEEYRYLLNLKKKIIARSKAREKYHDYQIEDEIRHIIFKLSVEFKDSDIIPLSMEALNLDEKSDGSLETFTKHKIRNEIREYYIYIKQQFQLLDKQTESDSFDLIASQVNTFYKALKKNVKSQEEIYEQMTEWLSKKTQNSSKYVCGIIISFFIQNCEVF